MLNSVCSPSTFLRGLKFTSSRLLVAIWEKGVPFCRGFLLAALIYWMGIGGLLIGNAFLLDGQGIQPGFDEVAMLSGLIADGFLLFFFARGLIAAIESSLSRAKEWYKNAEHPKRTILVRGARLAWVAIGLAMTWKYLSAHFFQGSVVSAYVLAIAAAFWGSVLLKLTFKAAHGICAAGRAASS